MGHELDGFLLGFMNSIWIGLTRRFNQRNSAGFSDEVLIRESNKSICVRNNHHPCMP